MEGKAAEGTPSICDVRDVACAHVAAAERPSASGRYIVSQRAPITPSFVSQTLRVGRPCNMFFGWCRVHPSDLSHAFTETCHAT